MDAWELYGDEGRDKLRKAAERSTYPVTRGWPNGVTHLNNQGLYAEYIGVSRATPGELNHLSTRRKRNQHEIPQVVASERGGAQTQAHVRFTPLCAGGSRCYTERRE